jgi:rhodanese-related sulfurtransferase
MPCCPSKSILLQAAAIVALGGAIGVVDAFQRPISLGRVAPPPIDLTPSTTGTGKTAPAPAPPKPDSPAAATAGAAAPAGAFKPTPKADLPAGQITLEEAKALFDRGATFIDTRKPEDYEAGHVQNAYRISNSDFTHGDPAILAAVPRDAEVVCYCVGGHCDESEQVARNLAGSGYAKVYVLHDGFPGWKAMGYPVETGKGVQP